MNKEYEELKKKIENKENMMEELKEEIKALKKEFEIVGKPILIREKIRRFEDRCKEAAPWSIESLVRIGETKEEWVERFGKLTRGGSGNNSDTWINENYEALGYTNSYYIKWLVEVDDERVVNTEIYRKTKGK